MKKVLCFGDSNTYGYIPGGEGLRFDKNSRWTGILQNLSEDNYLIIEHGCNNRTGFCENKSGVNFCGYKVLPEVLAEDLDFVILQLGINDLQFQYHTTFEDIRTGLENLVKIIREKSKEIKIILLAPSRLNENVLKSYFSIMFDETSISKSLKLGEIYREVAEKNNCILINLDKIVKTSDKDGLHYEASEHEKIAGKIFKTLNHLA